jgi:hypothetical protein
MATLLHQFAVNLAGALLSGEWRLSVLIRRGRRSIVRKTRWLKPLIERVFTRFPECPRDDRLVHFIETDEACRAAIGRTGVTFRERFAIPVRMWPPSVPLLDTPPALDTTSALVDWIGLTPERLDWYADFRGINSAQRVERLRHYTYRWVPKPGPNPAGKHRLIEAPKPGLKRVQRQILKHILNLPPPHDAAHGFRTGRGIVSNAAPHCGRAVVLRFDLRDFFPSVPAAKVRAVFRAIGYPQAVADALTGLCSAKLPDDVWDARPNPAADGADHFAGLRLRQRHLPQGAPTLPSLANLSAFGLDIRLAALANELDATYTRYADDLTISGGASLSAAAGRVRRTVTAIAAEEGFEMQPHKTRVLRRGQRQRVAGVVVNVRPNVARADFDRLKAILTNCMRTGPAGQNRDAHPNFREHLRGRISHVAMVNSARGRKLYAIFDRIDFTREGEAPAEPK